MQLSFKKVLLASLISCFCLFGVQQFAHSAIVRDDVDYQEFRDFAENKGRFVAGASNIQVQDKNGTTLGTALNGAPMPDFSSVHRLYGTSTLIHPQYVASVAHNSHEDPSKVNHWHYYIQFGGQSQNPDAHHYYYSFVDENNDPTWIKNVNDKIYNDYQSPRLHKLVTEVVESPVTNAQENKIREDYITNKKYLAFARLGSGRQGIIDKSGTTLYPENNKISCEEMTGCTAVKGSYQYLIGGESVKFVAVSTNANGDKLLYGGGKDRVINGERINHMFSSPMANWSVSGDSGSPLFGFNKETQQWELVSFVRGRWSTGDYSYNMSIVAKPEFYKEKIEEDKVYIHNDKADDVYHWLPTESHQSQLIQTSTQKTDTVGLSSLDLKEQPTYRPNHLKRSALGTGISATGYQQILTGLNTGKTLHFTGESGTLELQNSIDQGAGALYFDNDFTVRAKDQEMTWLGAGVSVAKDKTVTWQVKNPENDRLSKLGEGTLLVNGIGENKGDISVGDGTVILNQQADSTGKKQAFNQVGIVSGRPTVKLMDSEQIDPNKLYFGYRGGRLDLNGNHLTFNAIQNVDEGAQIVNHHQSQKATVTLKGQQQGSGDFVHFGNDETGYFRLRGRNDGKTPLNRQSTLNWAYLGDGQDLAKEYWKQKNDLALITAFNGFLGETNAQKYNGQLDVVYHPQERPQESTLLLTGGSQLNGQFNVKAGTVLLSGRPRPYAVDWLTEGGKEIVKEDDWLNRQFNATTFKIENEGKLYVGRNVSHVNANFDLSNRAFAQLGFVQGKTPVCIRSDYHGETTCEQSSYGTNTLNSIPTTHITGNLNLKDTSQLTLGKAHLTGSSVASRTSKMNMSPDAHWTMTKNSQVGHLAMENGSQITLNSSSQPTTSYNTLTILGNLTGVGRFNYLTDLAQIKGDKVVVQGTAEGKYGLYLQNTGKEPSSRRRERLTLLSLQNRNQATKKVNVELLNPNQVVDVGAYRYKLQNDGVNYYLSNPSINIDQLIARKMAKFQTTSTQTSTTTTARESSSITTRSGLSLTESTLNEQQQILVNQPITLDPQVTEDTEISQEIEPIAQAQSISRYTNAGLSDLSAQINSMMYMGQGLNHYLLSDYAHNVWLSVHRYNTKHQSDLYRQYTKDDTITQIGSDVNIDLKQGKLKLGTAWSYNMAENQYADHQLGKAKTSMLSLYSKFNFNNHNFMTFDTGYGVSNNQIISEGEKTKFQRKVATTGLNFGRTFQTSVVDVQPSVGVRYHYLSDASYQLNGANIKIDNTHLVSYQAGLQIEKAFPLMSGLVFTPSLSSYYVNTPQKQSNIWVNGHQFNQAYGRYHSHHLGLNFAKPTWETGLRVGYADGNEINRQTSVNLLFNYKW